MSELFVLFFVSCRDSVILTLIKRKHMLWIETGLRPWGFHMQLTSTIILQ